VSAVSTREERTAALAARQVAAAYRELARCSPVGELGSGRERHAAGVAADLERLAALISPVLPSLREQVLYELAGLRGGVHLVMLTGEQLAQRARMWDQVAASLAPDVD
jgi:hypothetical protein